MTGTVDATQELGAFLRARRERLDPRDVGLPARRARRTPGLRREDVAELAGVSTDYIVRLEQGRGLRPSAEVLEALARARRRGGAPRADRVGQAPPRQPPPRQPPPPPPPGREQRGAPQEAQP
ncbi:helix-turn-helix domain-containing protein, partial [Nocardia wallacei]|uniref:helix-turn-helix domain-containing protein n=1 Tax=Nocardia wallacei TaxID=480035 RepID=UPI0024564474